MVESKGGSYEDSWHRVESIHSSEEGAINRVKELQEETYKRLISQASSAMDGTTKYLIDVREPLMNYLEEKHYEYRNNKEMMDYLASKSLSPGNDMLKGVFVPHYPKEVLEGYWKLLDFLKDERKYFQYTKERAQELYNTVLHDKDTTSHTYIRYKLRD
jgi:hypothetical protein